MRAYSTRMSPPRSISRTTPVLVTSEDVTIGKSHPERHDLTARQLGMNVKERLLFQDAAADILAARAVHARVTRAH
jgi:beta-phosphoglucomutase-like phosphatase (HAD superfamily)